MKVWRLLSISLVLVAACTEHDWQREIDRVGGPIPDPGVSCPVEPDPEAQLPCDIRKILKVCQQCHTGPEPRPNGAPFPLHTFNDVLGDYGGPIYQAMYQAVKSDFMPLCADGSCLPAYEASLVGGKPSALTPEEKAAFLAYFKCPEPVFGEQPCPP